MTTQAVIVGLGAQSALGLRWPPTAAAVRAQLSAYARDECLPSCENGEALMVCRIPGLPPRASQRERMQQLGLAAASEALEPWLAAEAHAPSRRTELPVVLSVPPERPGLSASDQMALARSLIDALPLPVDRKRCGLAKTGHEAGLSGIELAAREVIAGHAEAYLVGGVESYLDIDALHFIERQGRLKTEARPEGFVPGEGAGFVLICDARIARERKLRVFAEIAHWGRGLEPRSWRGREPTLGQGLTQALQAIFQPPQLTAAKVKFTYSDFNGEPWRAEEWGYAYVRTGAHHGSPLDHRHPAAYWGDLGAASGPMLVGMAALDLTRESSETLALVCGSADLRPERAACLLRTWRD